MSHSVQESVEVGISLLVEVVETLYVLYALDVSFNVRLQILKRLGETVAERSHGSRLGHTHKPVQSVVEFRFPFRPVRKFGYYGFKQLFRQRLDVLVVMLCPCRSRKSPYGRGESLERPCSGVVLSVHAQDVQNSVAQFLGLFLVVAYEFDESLFVLGQSLLVVTSVDCSGQLKSNVCHRAVKFRSVVVRPVYLGLGVPVHLPGDFLQLVVSVEEVGGNLREESRILFYKRIVEFVQGILRLLRRVPDEVFHGYSRRLGEMFARSGFEQSVGTNPLVDVPEYLVFFGREHRLESIVHDLTCKIVGLSPGIVQFERNGPEPAVLHCRLVVDIAVDFGKAVSYLFV